MTKMRWSGQERQYGKAGTQLGKGFLAGTQICKGFLTNPSILCDLRQMCHIILLFKFPVPYFKISQGFYALFLSATLSEHSNMGFFCLLRLQPYAECQLAWSKNDSKAPPRLSVQISDLYLKTHFAENAFWWCLLMHVFLQAEHTEGAQERLAPQLCTLQLDMSIAAFTAGSSHLRPVLPSPRLCWLWFTQ